MRKKELLEDWKRSRLITDKKVLDAFMAVPRELFVVPEYKEQAYGDYPLPIPGGQTISQPTTVMIITQALELGPGMKVLEVGAGSGYQAAIISEIVGKQGMVIATEIVSELAVFAESNLHQAGISNVEVVNWDGGQGYEKQAPYDRIVVSAACKEVPPLLISQLNDGGIVVAPVGGIFGQQLIKLKKTKEGIERHNLGDFMFVPLKGKNG